MIVATLERISTLITDDRATDEELDLLRGAGVKVITVKVEERDEPSSVKVAAP
jgi:DeoR/GlpR family transcriptional regulator of sugar metabolism